MMKGFKCDMDGKRINGVGCCSHTHTNTTS